MGAWSKLKQYDLGFKMAMKQRYIKEVSKIDANHPVFQLYHDLVRKNAIDNSLLEENSFFLKKQKLNFTQKQKIFNIGENWKNQPFVSHRCTVCHRDIPGPQEVMIQHARSHFKKDGEEHEVHPYKY